MAILAVNAGSSTLKFSIHPLQGRQVQAPILTGNIQGLEPGGSPEMGWTLDGQRAHRTLTASQDNPFGQALVALRELLTRELSLPVLQAVAHRVVHGGQDFRSSTIVTPAILAALEGLNSLAPLHQPHNLAGIRSFSQTFAHLPQVACFDTAYHATLPELEYCFALPQALSAQGVRRYGFHGLSYQSIMGTLQQHSPRAGGRTLMAHLGNGASLCAALEGRSVATTMGFSALDGLMMGTRCGSIDPGVLLYLLEQGWSHERIQSLLYKQSGLLGVSGIARRPSLPLTCSRTASYAAPANSRPACPASIYWPSVVASAKTMPSCVRRSARNWPIWACAWTKLATSKQATRVPVPSTQQTAQWKFGWCPRTKAMWPRRKLRR